MSELLQSYTEEDLNPREYTADHDFEIGRDVVEKKELLADLSNIDNKLLDRSISEIREDAKVKRTQEQNRIEEQLGETVAYNDSESRQYEIIVKKDGTYEMFSFTEGKEVDVSSYDKEFLSGMTSKLSNGESIVNIDLEYNNAGVSIPLYLRSNELGETVIGYDSAFFEGPQKKKGAVSINHEVINSLTDRELEDTVEVSSSNISNNIDDIILSDLREKQGLPSDVSIDIRKYVDKSLLYTQETNNSQTEADIFTVSSIVDSAIIKEGNNVDLIGSLFDKQDIDTVDDLSLFADKTQPSPVANIINIDNLKKEPDGLIQTIDKYDFTGPLSTENNNIELTDASVIKKEHISTDISPFELQSVKNNEVQFLQVNKHETKISLLGSNDDIKIENKVSRENNISRENIESSPLPELEEHVQHVNSSKENNTHNNVKVLDNINLYKEKISNASERHSRKEASIDSFNENAEILTNELSLEQRQKETVTTEVLSIKNESIKEENETTHEQVQISEFKKSVTEPVESPNLEGQKSYDAYQESIIKSEVSNVDRNPKISWSEVQETMHPVAKAPSVDPISLTWGEQSITELVTLDILAEIKEAQLELEQAEPGVVKVVSGRHTNEYGSSEALVLSKNPDNTLAVDFYESSFVYDSNVDQSEQSPFIQEPAVRIKDSVNPTDSNQGTLVLRIKDDGYLASDEKFGLTDVDDKGEDILNYDSRRDIIKTVTNETENLTLSNRPRVFDIDIENEGDILPDRRATASTASSLMRK